MLRQIRLVFFGKADDTCSATHFRMIDARSSSWSLVFSPISWPCQQRLKMAHFGVESPTSEVI